MKKGDIVDLLGYRNRQEVSQSVRETAISEELQTAIQHLITRLRESGPIQ